MTSIWPLSLSREEGASACRGRRGRGSGCKGGISEGEIPLEMRAFIRNDFDEAKRFIGKAILASAALRARATEIVLVDGRYSQSIRTI